MMKLHFWKILVVLLLFTKNVYAETKLATPLGEMSSVTFGFVSCSGHKPIGFPVYFVIRTNRPDAFFNNFQIVRTCLILAKAYIDDPKKFKSKNSPLYEISETSQYAGGFESLLCRKTQSKAGEHLSYEFLLPWLAMTEVEGYMQEKFFMACLSTMETRDLPPTQQKYDFGKES